MSTNVKLRLRFRDFEKPEAKSQSKVTKNDPLYLFSTKKSGGYQEGEHEVVQPVQGQHY